MVRRKREKPEIVSGDEAEEPEGEPRRNLTAKQALFIEHYLQCWNATEAARRAGYSEDSVRQIGAENLTKPYIAEEVKRRIDELTMKTDEALLRLTKQARSTMADFVKLFPGVNMPMIDWHAAAANGALDVVKEITIKDGEISFKLYDAQSALVHIIKQRQLLEGKPTERTAFMTEETGLASEFEHLVNRASSRVASGSEDVGS